MTDGRKNNRFAPPARALDATALEALHSMLALGVTQRKIAMHLGVHWRTIANAVHKRGAYAQT